MPGPLRWLARVLTVLLALALVLTGVVVWTVRQSFPQLEGTLRVPGLSAAVEVYRDRFGIPHIYADTPEDLFLAQGYVHAQDRFWEMDFRRHVTAGRLSELFGRSTLDQDKAIRTMGWRRVAEKELPELRESTRRYLDAYAEGVNAWLAAHPDASARSFEYSVLKLTNRDYRPEKWTAVDSVAWLKAMAWDLRSNVETEIDRALTATRLPPQRVAQLFPEYPFDRHDPIVTQGAISGDRFDPQAMPGDADAALIETAAETLQAVPDLMSSRDRDGIGSNSWVVSGDHTTTGKPILANDPHLSATMPSVWYQAGLHCRTKSQECPFDLTGFTFSGVPGVIIGHNDRIAWGFTNLGPDVADLFLEKVEGDTYLYKGETRPLEKRTETIKVAGGDPVTLEVRSTVHGPLVGEVLKIDPGAEANAVALQWTALTPGASADAIFAMNEARDWHEFRAAASLFEVPAQNLIYADVDGRIGYQAPGRIPVRLKGDGTVPVPGWTGEYDWKPAPIPFDQLPSVTDPPEGYIVTANNAVIDSRRYGPLLTKDWAYGYRSQRIIERIKQALQKGKISAQTMAEIQQDSHNGLAATLVPHLMRVPLAGPAAEARKLLEGWDGWQTVSSRPAAYFNAVWRHLLKLTFDDELPAQARPTGGDRWFEVVRSLLDRPDDPFWDDVRTPVKETRDDMLRLAMVDAYEEVGADTPWGEVHTLTLTNQTFGSSGIAPIEMLFNRGPFGVPGNKDAVNATGWNVQRGYEITAVPSMRMVVDLADMDKSGWINLTGASGHAYHDNYWDQTALWTKGELLPMYSKPESVKKAATHTLRLVPGS
ncbi:penicillin acylase family protein [Thermoactinospora rubra]|uniref:penicillin acylase family protein n=1 Tax=Thermoactinospora rubra TaxID=1088767 RepID=UPI000A106229|nr:penicillin acylase family protein [Thermoactinospora rubra]